MEKNDKQQENAENVTTVEGASTVENNSSKPIFLWVAIVILLSLLAATAWFMQQQLQKQQGVTADLEARFAASEQLANQFSELKQTATKDASTIQQRLAELNSADISLVEKLDTLTQAQQLTNDDVLRTWALAEVKFLLNTANQSILLAGDVEKTQTALTLADQQIQSLSDPRLHPLRALLADEQLALSSLAKVDIAGLAVQLQSAIKGVDRLQILMGPAVVAASEGESDTSLSLPDSLQSAASSAWQEIKSLVVIRHQDDANAALLVPEQRYFLYQNLQLKLESARLALLSGQETIFHDSLASAAQWLQQYFVGGERDAMLEMLKQMHSQTIKIELPDISASLIWLQQYGDQQ